MMKIMEKIDKYLNEGFETTLKSTLTKMLKMKSSDEKDEIAYDLMNYVDKKRMKINKLVRDNPKLYNKNIDISKEVNDMIGIFLDSENASMSDIMKIVKKFGELTKG